MVSVRQLQAATDLTCGALAKGTWDPADPERFPYYGFYDVDLFDCLPFVMFTANDCPRAINIFNRDFELTSMKLWCHLARQATCIVDVGAHVGVYSLAAAALRQDVPIHAFEPNPHAFARLKMHVEINKFTNVIEHPVALSDTKGTHRFGWAEKSLWQISSGGSISTAGMKIQSDYLDNSALLDFGSRGLMKIDVEGHEYKVISGARCSIDENKPDIILESFCKDSCRAISDLLPPGYSFYRIHEDAGTLEPMPTLLPASTKGKDYNAFLTTRPVPSQFLGAT